LHLRPEDAKTLVDIAERVTKGALALYAYNVIGTIRKRGQFLD
jgi:hypothetical protein